MAGSLRNVAIVTLGCKLNQADSDSLARSFAAAGCAVGSTVEGADAVVINSCTVTHVADSKARALIRRARRRAPAATIALTGCYADSGGAPAALAAGADLTFRNREKDEMVDAIFRVRTGHGAEPGAAGERPALRGLRTRAFIKIQEGCNDVCAFCIVPRVRGRELSRSVDEIVEEARSHESLGVKEIVLTGTQLGHYGRDRGWAPGPHRLLEALLERTSVPRIRISSLQAQDLSPAFLALWANLRLCPHFHIPLQSGSDTVLARMRRRYTVKQYRDGLRMIRDLVDGASVTTDVIAGFPGETELEFEASADLCERSGFSAMHVFPYSARQGTAAALMVDQVDAETKRKRTQRLLDISRRAGRAYRENLLGSVHNVMFEERVEGTTWSGLTANYLRVHASSKEELTGCVRAVCLDSVKGDTVMGSLRREAKKSRRQRP
jgi:threonylcarbamoyladenosine tRNA methylthiotransferase MtaB